MLANDSERSTNCLIVVPAKIELPFLTRYPKWLNSTKT